MTAAMNVGEVHLEARDDGDDLVGRQGREGVEVERQRYLVDGLPERLPHWVPHRLP
jgi:hypothetical protein